MHKYNFILRPAETCHDTVLDDKITSKISHNLQYFALKNQLNLTTLSHLQSTVILLDNTYE